MSQARFSSHQPSQARNLQHLTTIKKKKTQKQTKETNPNWTKEEDEALCKAWLQNIVTHLAVRESLSIGGNKFITL